MAIESIIMGLIPLILILVLVEIILKGISLWKCGRNNQLVWYVCLFIFNTAGILPLVYLLFFSKKKSKKR